LPSPRDVALPALFVVLWSTGFVFARLGLPYAAPFTFLGVRMAVAAALMLAIALVTRAAWPRDARAGAHVAVAGLLLNGAYLIGVFEAVDLGVATGVVALIAGLQPILTAAVVGPLLGERVSPIQWAGFLLGFVGVAVVVVERLGIGAGTPAGFALAFLCLAGITGGTLYQKRFCQDQDPISGSAIQFAVSAAALAIGALAFENRIIVWSDDFVVAFLWLTLVLSVGTFNLLVLLIRRGEASRVSGLFYLVPPCTAVFGWLMFGEALSALALAGMAAAVAGVALVNHQRR
jgi:drug/metabolite transporter (DMT)-like permease